MFAHVLQSSLRSFIKMRECSTTGGVHIFNSYAIRSGGGCLFVFFFLTYISSPISIGNTHHLPQHKKNCPQVSRYSRTAKIPKKILAAPEGQGEAPSMRAGWAEPRAPHRHPRGNTAPRDPRGPRGAGGRSLPSPRGCSTPWPEPPCA